LPQSFLKNKTEEQELPEKKDIPVVESSPETGLTSAQVREREQGGWQNTPIDPPSKTTKQIVLDNIFTYFNLLFFILAFFVCLVGQWLNVTFLGVVFWNTLIGIVQELKAKKKLEELNILAAPKAKVIRDSKEQIVETAKLVRDDIVVFASGNQIYADAVVVSGEVHVNEALITGESDEILKKPGDELLSGSFIINGSCCARLTAVGADSFVSKLTLEAKKAKPPRQSEMMRSLTNLIKWIGIIVIPFGVIMFIKEYTWLGRDLPTAVTSTVGSIVGMVPQGLYLLTSLALLAGVLRLAQRNTLVHDMDCIETLARVDVLCVDKTGTITENKMTVEDVVLLNESQVPDAEVRTIMADYVYAMQTDNDTMAALKRYFTGEKRYNATESMAFTSSKKYGGVTLEDGSTYLLGAPEILYAPERDPHIAELVQEYSAKGCRVLLLAKYGGSLSDESLSLDVKPYALMLLSNKIRDEAPETFAYFAQQGVEIKVISGDNPVTVSEVAGRAGIVNAERYIDARTLETDKDIQDAVDRYTVFGRVTPDQKKKLVLALKAQGHTVAMTGDGVNDVLALKEADCSIAMASGSDVASHASHIVLLDSNFSSMPSVVAEGRRVINNIELSASLYLWKNIFTFCLAVITLIFSLPFPYTPAQMALVNAMTIGIPSFVLALEPNENLISGKFLRNVLRRAWPTAMTDLVLVLGIMAFYTVFDMDDSMLGTVCTGVMGIVGLMMVYKTSKPFNVIRIIMFAAVTAAYAFCYLFIPTWFTLEPLNASGALLLIVFGALAWSVFTLLNKFNDKLKTANENFVNSVKEKKSQKEQKNNVEGKTSLFDREKEERAKQARENKPDPDPADEKEENRDQNKEDEAIIYLPEAVENLEEDHQSNE